jgi:hypothetical protein
VIAFSALGATLEAPITPTTTNLIGCSIKASSEYGVGVATGVGGRGSICWPYLIDSSSYDISTLNDAISSRCLVDSPYLGGTQKIYVKWYLLIDHPLDPPHTKNPNLFPKSGMDQH